MPTVTDTTVLLDSVQQIAETTSAKRVVPQRVSIGGLYRYANLCIMYTGRIEGFVTLKLAHERN